MRRLIKLVMVSVLGVILVTVLLGGCSGTAAPAQSAADFYKGKSIEFNIMTTAGGGHDAISRIYAEGLAKYTGASVVPVNKPGGGFMLSPIYVATTAKQDGLTISSAEALSCELAQVLKQEGMEKNDITKWNWLCSMRGMLQIVFVKKDSPYNSLGDIIKANTIFKLNTPSLTSNNAMFGLMVMRPATGKDLFKVYAAVEGGADQVASVVRGEFQGGALPANRINAYKDQIKPIVCLGENRDPLVPDVPTLKEALKAANVTSPDLDFWINIINGTSKSLTAIMAGPGVPQDRVAFLRSALEQTGKDPDLVAKAKKADLGMKWISGEDMTAEIQQFVKMAPDKVAAFKAAIDAAKMQ